jgi:hypothetical protein
MRDLALRTIGITGFFAQGLPTRIQISRLGLLYLTGVLNTPIGPSFDLRHMYAILRYWWAFDAGRTDLALNPMVAEIDRHQKNLLSDEIGCGFAGEAMLLFGVTHYSEVDRLIRLGYANLVRTRDRSQPDYVGIDFLNHRVIVCEAKGSQSSTTYHQLQLARGKNQVSNLNFVVPGYTTVRIVSAILLGGANGPYDSQWTISDPRGRQKTSEIKLDPAVIIRMHYASLLRLIGADEGAETLEIGRAVDLSSIKFPEMRLFDKTEYMGRIFSGTLFRSTETRSFFVGIDSKIAKNWLDFANGTRPLTIPPRLEAIELLKGIPNKLAAKFPDGGFISLE